MEKKKMLKCMRCGGIWGQRFKGRKPKKCTYCNSQYWETKRGILPRGNPQLKSFWQKYKQQLKTERKPDKPALKKREAYFSVFPVNIR
jgi:DNA-directed RNA polymerase subunit RPC12/RpoP